MPVTYEACGEDVAELVGEVVAAYHEDLRIVTIGAVFASSEDKDGEAIPAIKKDGHAVVGRIQITSLADRARGMADAKLTLDRHEWDAMSKSRRIALLDHELTHLELKTDDDGPVLDDLGRPKLKARHHDWHLTGFAQVAERHGEAAIEVREMVRWQEEYGQYALFPMKGTKPVKAAANA